MKITELLGVKKFADMKHTEILDYIEKLGGTDIKVLGAGETGVAIQIGENVYKMWMLDSGYNAFVRYALANQSNPCMPKFKGKVKRMPAFFLRSQHAPDYVNYIQVEKLKPIYPGDDKQMMFQNGSADPIALSSILGYCAWLGAAEIEDLRFKLNLQEDADPAVINLVLTIEDVMTMVNADEGQREDMHVGNLMMRGDQVVIIDPISSVPDMKLADKLRNFAKTLAKSPTRRVQK